MYIFVYIIYIYIYIYVSRIFIPISHTAPRTPACNILSPPGYKSVIPFRSSPHAFFLVSKYIKPINPINPINPIVPEWGAKN